jgi:adenosylcobinamide hydrolase
MRYVKSTEISENGDMATAVIRLSERMEVLSSAILNGGHAVTDTLFIMQVSHEFDDPDPVGFIKMERDRLSLPKDSVGLMTAAEVKYVFTEKTTGYEGMETFAAVTAGLSNQVIAGDIMENWAERKKLSMERYRALVGTINIIGVSPVALADEAKINLMMPIIEAKTAALASLGYKETGTTSDAVAIVSPIGDVREIYAGTGIPLGISMARSVKAGVRESLEKRGDYPLPGTILDKLSAVGIDREMLWDAAMEIYIPNPEWNVDELKSVFDGKLDIVCKDINISSLVQGALELDEIGNRDGICAMPKGMFAQDPIHLIADEIIGMQIAQYIAGTRGIFEFHRFDRYKPGIIGKADPFLDDMLCGLVGGIMSSVYSEMFDRV